MRAARFIVTPPALLISGFLLGDGFCVGGVEAVGERVGAGALGGGGRKEGVDVGALCAFKTPQLGLDLVDAR